MLDFSICIPIYNQDVKELVLSLEKQAINTFLSFEILLIDDASAINYRIKNCQLQRKNIRYIQAEENMGRSSIRNFLAKTAQGKLLIMMDCDSLLIDDGYIERFLNAQKDNAVLCGGTQYKSPLEQKNCILRWKFGIARETINADIRNANKYRLFFSNNFAIPKKLFELISFDETINGYGYEDTLFSFQLQEKQIDIIHINNPVYHIGLEDNHTFMIKTKNAIKNLHHLIDSNKINQTKSAQINLLNTYFKIKRWHLLMPIKVFFYLFENFIESNLCSTNPKLFFFDLYKLNWFIKYSNK